MEPTLTPPITGLTVLRRACLWTFICAFSAAPSFLLAQDLKADVAGMITGVAIFAVAYTVFSCTRSFERLYRRRFIRETMYCGYGLRVVLSGLALLAYAGNSIVFAVPDMWCGIASVLISNWFGLDVARAGRSPAGAGFERFAATLLTTCVQGAILNVVVFIFMSVVYFAQRLFRDPLPRDEVARGFEVLPATTEQR